MSKLQLDETKDDEQDEHVLSDTQCGCGSKEIVESAIPSPKETETHEQYMSRCIEMGYSEEECMSAHEGHKFKAEGYDEEEENKFASEDYEEWEEEDVTAAEYQGRKVTLNKPFRTPNENKKFGVYTKNEKGTVVIVRFGDPNMEIKRDDPKRRKAFRDRHNCATPGPKWKARYWSCKMWSSKPVNKITSEEESSCGCATQTAADEQVSCPTGSIQVGDTCVPVTVVSEIAIDSIEAIASASSGRSVIRISGVAFTDGYNKNKWALTRRAAQEVVEQMIGADVTLNHPQVTESGQGFGRNMSGDVDEAVVGIITEAYIKDEEEDKYKVRYSAEIHRAELFEALESGLWLRGEYGVSIGGYGIPMKSDDDGMVFDEGFTFDHLAIVHKPAYPGATIDTVEKLAKAKYSTNTVQDEQVSDMTDEHIPETEEIPIVASDEVEQLRANLILAQATIEEFKANEQAKIEEARQVLVSEASELGLKGHEDLSTDTIQSLIASWKEAHPDPEPVVLEAATPASDENVAQAVEAVEAPKSVIANYLNGTKVETDEGLYARTYNAWAKAWNSTLSPDDRQIGYSAMSYEELKDAGIAGPRGVIG